ncbi:ACT domain-containing protein [Raineyella fluvialis]|uniref:ACT domain-containing protein n=1 Tax=Raineyella fluvialis TaxID=2662261 RepID=A0A5Q2FBS0_9ACTN|nr:ACT domain-containing protein [Raineyella fluvialis]QGF23167.1 ACT domain-containing protein [Raineyella fluvialis]
MTSPRHVPESGSGRAPRSGGVTDLDVLLGALTPQLTPDPMVYAVVQDGRVPTGSFATVEEAEGLTVVLDQRSADREGLGYDHVAALITLQVHSALEAVGLTAAVSTALAARGISCNVIAGAYHDHLLVPWNRRAEAMAALEALRAG